MTNVATLILSRGGDDATNAVVSRSLVVIPLITLFYRSGRRLLINVSRR